jgi:8-oxo-dGTP diphosphatase
MSITYEFPRPAVTVDCVVFGVDDEGLQLLLIERDDEPFAGRWALPGSFVHEDEDLDDAARRALTSKTQLKKIYLEQLYTFGTPGRDPRGHVVTVAYYGLVRLRDHRVRAATGARDVRWHPASALPPLPFDHPRIAGVALDRLRAKVTYEPAVVFELMPPRFTLTRLQRLYEAILGTALDKRNFRKKMLTVWGIVVETDEMEAGPVGRPARLHAFDVAAYKELRARGVQFLL